MMANDSRIVVRLEGHADERGSREYNIGLGERRAQAVRQALLIQGVDGSQISTVSFGEERPEALGSSESDYAQNRRVVFVYARTKRFECSIVVIIARTTSWCLHPYSSPAAASALLTPPEEDPVLIRLE